MFEKLVNFSKHFKYSWQMASLYSNFIQGYWALADGHFNFINFKNPYYFEKHDYLCRLLKKMP